VRTKDSATKLAEYLAEVPGHTQGIEINYFVNRCSLPCDISFRSSSFLIKSRVLAMFAEVASQSATTQKTIPAWSLSDSSP
jgi:hypothetical protein